MFGHWALTVEGKDLSRTVTAQQHYRATRGLRLQFVAASLSLINVFQHLYTSSRVPLHTFAISRFEANCVNPANEYTLSSLFIGWIDAVSSVSNHCVRSQVDNLKRCSGHATKTNASRRSKHSRYQTLETSSKVYNIL